MVQHRSSVALVTTVWLASAASSSAEDASSRPSSRHASVLNAFLLYHLEIGIAKIFVFFDDESQLQIHALHPKVQEHEANGRIELQYAKEKKLADDMDDDACETTDSVYARCVNFERFRDVLHEDVAARQMLNAELAMQRCLQHNEEVVQMQAQGKEDAVGELRWLLHLDIDELLYLEAFASASESGTTPAAALSAYVGVLEQQHAHQWTIVNYEAIPTQLHGGNYFTTASRFRKHHARIPWSKSHNQQRALAFWQRRSPFRHYFLFYDNGKSMVRVAKRALPASVHHWQIGSVSAQTKPSSSKSNFFDARRNVSQANVYVEPVGSRACVLHYPVCGVEWLSEKYERLGRFPNVWGGTTSAHEGRRREMKIPPCFHTQARDARWRGADQQPDSSETSSDKAVDTTAALEELYRTQVMLDMHAHAAEWEQQVDAGVCEEIRFPMDVLASYELSQGGHREEFESLDESRPRDGSVVTPSSSERKKPETAVASASATSQDFAVEKAWMLASISQQYLCK